MIPDALQGIGTPGHCRKSKGSSKSVYGVEIPARFLRELFMCVQGEVSGSFEHHIQMDVVLCQGLSKTKKHVALLYMFFL